MSAQKRAVLTGASGFIGKQVLRELQQQGFAVTVILRPGSPRNADIPRGPLAELLELPREEMACLAQRLPPQDLFVHLAWAGARGPARLDRMLQDENEEAGLLAVRTAISLGCEAFVGCGSQAEYGRQRGQTTETTPAVPQTEYGRAKLAVCSKGAQLARAAGLRFVWPRIFSVYGPGDDAGTLADTAMRKMCADAPVDLTDCTQDWDYLHVRDAAAALVFLAREPRAHGVYNVAYGESHPLRWYLETMRGILKSESSLRFGAIAPGADGLAGFRPNVQKIEALGWKPAVPFAQGVEEYKIWLTARRQ